MRPDLRKAAALLSLTALLYGGAAPLLACGLEGGPGDGLKAAHPGSLELAFAVQDALAGARLLPDPELGADLAHERADTRLRGFAATLTALPTLQSAQSRQEARPRPAVAVLLVENGSWTRMTAQGGRWTLTQHIDGPQNGDLTLLASELALRELLEGRWSADDLMAQAWLLRDGPANERAQLLRDLREAYPARKKATQAMR